MGGGSDKPIHADPGHPRLEFPTAASDLPWTGERYLVGRGGEIEFERYHRYLFAVQFCRERDVLDIASGEGYGGLLLSGVARSVIGIDIDPGTIAHASAAYRRNNLKFIKGACSEIPLPDRSIDTVVSFETIEHIREHEEFLGEVRRVLRPDGVLIISTPDRDVYAKPEDPNPFHSRELAKPEFRQLLLRHFQNLAVGAQKALAGSAILPDQPQQPPGLHVFHRMNEHTFEEHQALEVAPFLLVVASNAALPEIKWGILADSSFLPELREERALMAQQLAYQKGLRQTEIKQLAERNRDFQQRISADLADREDRLRNADQDIRGLMVEIDKREERLRNADRDIRNLMSEVGKREERLRNADRDIRKLMSEATDREERVRNANQAVQDLKGEIEDRERRLAAADADSRRLIAEIEVQSRRVSAADSELAAAKGRLEEIALSKTGRTIKAVRKLVPKWGAGGG